MSDHPYNVRVYLKDREPVRFDSIYASNRMEACQMCRQSVERMGWVAREIVAYQRKPRSE